MINSVKESITARKGRKGPASAVDEDGAFWIIERAQIMDQHNPHTGEWRRHEMAARHYQSGRVAVRLHGQLHMRDIPIDSWALDIEGAENCTTIEALACLIEGVLNQGDESEVHKPALSRLGRWGRQQLRDAFPDLPVADPAPDEIPA